MPGINQLGGALTTTPTPSPAESKGDNQATNPQAQAGLQVARADAVRGVSNSKESDDQNATPNQREFAALARRRSERTDPKTGDVIKVGQDLDEEAAERAFGRDGRTSSESKERLKRSLNDLFAPRPRAQAKAAEPEVKEAPEPRDNATDDSEDIQEAQD